MERKKSSANELGPFEKGIDFVQHFSGRSFTTHDISDRYQCSLRQAQRILAAAHRFIHLAPDGWRPGDKGKDRCAWRMR